jgi:catechol 2,3-dioxygenase-like lactoylglutathione lyase family enzyme
VINMAGNGLINANHAIRIARPSLDLEAAERFYVDGLGLGVLFKKDGNATREPHDLLMVGPEGGQWHLELTVAISEADAVTPTPTPEDLLVIYLEEPVSSEAIKRAVAYGGTVVASNNPYWDIGGVTIADPDGYRVVLTQRSWGPVT